MSGISKALATWNTSIMTGLSIFNPTRAAGEAERNPVSQGKSEGELDIGAAFSPV
ncbi:hypothetical protein [Inquilinus limosus]|uniref:hypothetical protein n=1 Tax=Inquilinus limosus TaxID=171674 RepID=UPI003F5CC758